LAQVCPDPGKELGEGERLGQVVAGAVVEAGDDVVGLGQGRQHDYRQGLVVLPDSLDDPRGAELGQEDVENYQRVVA